MKHKNGFVFIETMIVIVVLIVSLLVLYSAYTGFITLERRFARYDDPGYLYKTQTIANFLENIKDPLGKSKLAEKIQKSINDDFIIISQFDDSGLFQNENEKKFYNNLIFDLRIQNVIVINKVQILKVINDYYNNPSNEFVSIIDDDFINYLKQLNLDNENTYYLIASFAEKNNGSECDPNQLANNVLNGEGFSQNKETSCIHYFGSVPIKVN